MVFFQNRAGGRPGATVRCRVCNGRGVKVTLRQLGPGMVQQMQSICPDCHGEGRLLEYWMAAEKCDIALNVYLIIY